MKKITLFICSICVIGLISFKNSYNFKTPPGTILVNDNLYMDINEIRNVDWIEYLKWIEFHEGKNSEKYKNALPSHKVFNKLINNSEAYLIPSFTNYPIVGISYEQALIFCKWRSNRVNENLYIKNNKIKDEDVSKIDVNNIPKVYEYRLPTKNEWENVLNNGNILKIENENITENNHQLSVYEKVGPVKYYKTKKIRFII